MSADKLTILNKQLALPIEWETNNVPAVIGKDILELLGSSMYIDPMSIFREYIQNAVDSIDEARKTKVLGPNEAGRVTIDVNLVTRTIKIRDNGQGLAQDEFTQRLTAVGESKKRGTDSRGFRGIGRLAGLGYCQELIFRSRALNATRVNELRWDCRKLRSLLRDVSFGGDLINLIHQTSTSRRIKDTGWPDHFFEVELVGVVRHGNDQLLNGAAIEAYLSEVAPVPFAPEFSYSSDITAALKAHINLGNIEIYLNGAKEPVYRPHRDELSLGVDKSDRYTELELFNIPAVDGGLAGIGWVLHHGYIGALPANTRVKGLRLRSGNVQIGGDDLLQELFKEPRFNSWAVGEVHVIDRRLVPNGRRDHFEQNVHLLNLLNYVHPIARQIATKCRTSSSQRKWLKDFTRYQSLANEKMAILRQGVLGKVERKREINQVDELLVSMEHIAQLGYLDAATHTDLSANVASIRKSLERVMKDVPSKSALSHVTASKRRAYEQMMALIYECSPNQTTAKALVDRILAKLK